jgi:hypothetical protein
MPREFLYGLSMKRWSSRGGCGEKGRGAMNEDSDQNGPGGDGKWIETELKERGIENYRYKK